MRNQYKKNIAIVVPCFNESETIDKLVVAIDSERDRLSEYYDLQYIFVDDGSTDGTRQLLKTYSEKRKYIFYRSFSYNSGHQSALRAGINAATHYDAVVMMDADLQHPPDLIEAMLNKWEDGYDLVQMIRDDSENDISFFRKIWSFTYYKILNLLSGLSLDQGASDFRLIDGNVAKIVSESRERNLFLRGYFNWLNVRRTTIKYIPAKRIAGTSKYSVKKLMKLAIQGILQFSEKPLKISMAIGVMTALVAFLYGAWLTILYLFIDQTVSGWTSLMVVVLFCFGITLTIMGIIGIYLAHLLSIEKQRPDFIVYDEKLPKSKHITKT